MLLKLLKLELSGNFQYYVFNCLLYFFFAILAYGIVFVQVLIKIYGMHANASYNLEKLLICAQHGGQNQTNFNVMKTEKIFDSWTYKLGISKVESYNYFF